MEIQHHLDKQSQKWVLITVIVAIQILLFGAYKSTDFEVHRNWLAICYSLPMKQWYYDTTSPWTLDYPPLFAYFEKGLSYIAKHIDYQMLDINNLDYDSWPTIAFQRSTVVVTNFIFIAAAMAASAAYAKRGSNISMLQLGLMVSCPSLLLVDHVHFQYNGMLTGILAWSILLMQQQKPLASLSVFTLLFNMKHLYVIAAPLYLVYVTFTWCTGPQGLIRFVTYGLVTCGLTGAIWSPFVYHGVIKQIISRLFPFQRGLLHAYWAPNFWALYAAADKALYLSLRRVGIQFDSAIATFTGGKVEVQDFKVLPNVTPSVCLAIMLLAMVPALIIAALPAKRSMFPKLMGYMYFCYFIFGYHVHEKAIIMAIIPPVISMTSIGDFIENCEMQIVAVWSLYPLLFGLQEYPIKYFVTILFILFFIRIFVEQIGYPRLNQLLLLAATMIALEVYCEQLHFFILRDQLPFLPLMIRSVFGALYFFTQFSVMFCRLLRQIRLHLQLVVDKTQ